MTPEEAAAKGGDPFLTIAKEIRNERRSQDQTWGEQNHTPEQWMVILTEEVGEACRAVLQRRSRNYRTELIQVAAVAQAAIESYERQGGAFDV